MSAANCDAALRTIYAVAIRLRLIATYEGSLFTTPDPPVAVAVAD